MAGQPVFAGVCQCRKPGKKKWESRYVALHQYEPRYQLSIQKSERTKPELEFEVGGVDGCRIDADGAAYDGLAQGYAPYTVTVQPRAKNGEISSLFGEVMVLGIAEGRPLDLWERAITETSHEGPPMPGWRLPCSVWITGRIPGQAGTSVKNEHGPFDAELQGPEPVLLAFSDPVTRARKGAVYLSGQDTMVVADQEDGAGETGQPEQQPGCCLSVASKSGHVRLRVESQEVRDELLEQLESMFDARDGSAEEAPSLDVAPPDHLPPAPLDEAYARHIDVDVRQGAKMGASWQRVRIGAEETLQLERLSPGPLMERGCEEGMVVLRVNEAKVDSYSETELRRAMAARPLSLLLGGEGEGRDGGRGAEELEDAQQAPPPLPPPFTPRGVAGGGMAIPSEGRGGGSDSGSDGSHVLQRRQQQQQQQRWDEGTTALEETLRRQSSSRLHEEVLSTAELVLANLGLEAGPEAFDPGYFPPSQRRYFQLEPAAGSSRGQVSMLRGGQEEGSPEQAMLEQLYTAEQSGDLVLMDAVLRAARAQQAELGGYGSGSGRLQLAFERQQRAIDEVQASYRARRQERVAEHHEGEASALVVAGRTAVLEEEIDARRRARQQRREQCSAHLGGGNSGSPLAQRGYSSPLAGSTLEEEILMRRQQREARRSQLRGGGGDVEAPTTASALASASASSASGQSILTGVGHGEGSSLLEHRRRRRSGGSDSSSGSPARHSAGVPHSRPLQTPEFHPHQSGSPTSTSGMAARRSARLTGRSPPPAIIRTGRAGGSGSSISATHSSPRYSGVGSVAGAGAGHGSLSRSLKMLLSEPYPEGPDKIQAFR